MSVPRPPGQDPRLQLVPAGTRSHAWLALLAFAIPVSLALVLPHFAHGPGVGAHWIAESLQTQRWLDRSIGVGMGVVLLAAVWIALEALLRRHRLRIDGTGLEIATTLYTRRVAWQDLDLRAARVVDLDEQPGARPLFKTNGYALPGFRSGWFRSRDFTRMFVATAGGLRLLRIPTRLGYTLLLQPVDARVLLARLLALAPAGHAGATPLPRGR